MKGSKSRSRNRDVRRYPIAGASLEAAALTDGVRSRIEETARRAGLRALETAIAAGSAGRDHGAAAAQLTLVAAQATRMASDLAHAVRTLDSPAATTAHALAALDQLIAA